jgi:O-antigen biosynthesis protein
VNSVPTKELENILSSRTWRWSKPIRAFYYYQRNAINSAIRKLKKNKSLENKKGHYEIIEIVARKNVIHSILCSRKSKSEKTKIFLDEIKSIKKYTSSLNPEISIIIPCFNQIEYTAACILSILKSENKHSFEIILADDCSNQDDYSQFEEVSPIVRVIRSRNNQGFIKTCNSAAKHAIGNYLVFLNNDCITLSGWLDKLVKNIMSDESVGIVGSKLLNSDGSLQEAGGIIWRDGSGWNYGRGKNPLDPEYNYVKQVDYCTGASFCIKKTVWELMGGFDEFFIPAYYEETDLSFRLRNKGFQTIYQPASVAIHLEGISNGTEINSGLKKYQVANSIKFSKRWKAVLEESHFCSGTHERYARDRSKNKKHMLFVDHYIPEYDKDAGSRQMHSYLKLFQKYGFQITFWPHNQLPNLEYGNELMEMGIEVITSISGFKDFNKWIVENGKYLDIAFLSRPHISINFIKQIRANSTCKVVYYGHDMHSVRMRQQNKVTLGSYSQETIDSIEKMEEECWQKSDLILYPSGEEVSFLRDKYPFRKIDILPIECRNETEIASSWTPNSYHEREGILFVGGFSHLPNEDAVIWFIDEIFPKVEQCLPQIRLTVAGNAPTDNIKKRVNKNISVTGRVTDSELYKLYNKARLVVVPLRIGAGVKGKVVESLRMGVPVISTPIGVQGLLGSETAIQVASHPDDIAKLLIKTYSSCEEWNKQRTEGIKFYKKNFLESRVAEKILPLLSN